MADSNAPNTVLTCLTFDVGGRLYALDVAGVREVVDPPAVTRVPRAPSFMLGAFNLRGRVVPLVDARGRFGLEAAPPTRASQVVVLEITHDGVPALLGVLADAVDEVLTVDADTLQEPPPFGTRLDPSLVRGVVRRADRFVTLLDADRVFSLEALTPSGPQTQPASHS